MRSNVCFFPCFCSCLGDIQITFSKSNASASRYSPELSRNFDIVSGFTLNYDTIAQSDGLELRVLVSQLLNHMVYHQATALIGVCGGDNLAELLAIWASISFTRAGTKYFPPCCHDFLAILNIVLEYLSLLMDLRAQRGNENVASAFQVSDEVRRGIQPLGDIQKVPEREDTGRRDLFYETGYHLCWIIGWGHMMHDY